MDSRDDAFAGVGQAGRARLPRRGAVVGSALAIAALLPACASAPDRSLTRTPGVLRIGTYFVNPPFEYVANGERIGFEVDLMNEIARRLAVRAEFVNTQWETILAEMQGGVYDCIVGGITITSDREKILAWSTPYMTTTLSLIVDERRSPRLRHLQDFGGAVVGVQAKTTDYDVAKAMLASGQIGAIKVYAFDRIGDAMVDLAAGRITAVMKVYPVAAWLARQTPGLRIVAQVPDDPQPLGIGLSRANLALLAAIDRTLAAMTQDGTLTRLAGRWAVAPA